MAFPDFIKMKYSDWKSFEKHLQSAAPDHLSSLYLVLGKEEFQRSIAEEALLSLLTTKYPLVRYDGHTLDERQLDMELNGLDLFATKRLLFISNADKLSKNAMEILQSYFPKAGPDLAVILSAQTINANTNFYKKAEKFGVVFAAEQAKPKDLEAICIQWLIKRAHGLQKSLSTSAAHLLFQHLGADYNSLLNELEKLALYVDDSAAIHEKDIVDLVKAIPQANSWKAGEAILQGNAKEAIDLCHNLLQTGTNLIALIRQLRYTFQTGYDILSLKPEELSVQYPSLKGFFLEKKLQLARQFGADRFRSAIIALDTSEFAAKDAQGDDELLMEMLITKMIAGLPTPLNLK